MKKYNKYLGLFLLSLGLLSCDNEEVYPPIEAEVLPTVALEVNGLDFSKYVSVGASFTAGFTDGALFIAAQENSFPNILASKFAMANGGAFSQPLMSDNIGGFGIGMTAVQPPRFFFNASVGGPERLDEIPTTNPLVSIAGSYNNYGIPGAKSFHFTFPGYGTLNPYFGRMTSNPASNTVIGDAAMAQPTFFTISEVGGNDVLGYALAGGTGVDQTGNLNPATYGLNDITDPNVFANVLNSMVTALTTNPNARGLVGNVPYITSLSHFTTVPFNPLDPTTNTDLAAQIPLLNTVYGAINQIYVGAGEPERSIVFSETASNPVVINDEDATDLTVAIATTLSSSPTFVPFVQSLGLPAAAAPLVANLLGQQYGKARSATENDLFVLPSSSVIGTVNTAHAGGLIALSGGLLPAELAGQFSAEGVTLPLADKWVITPQEQMAIRTAVDSYNATIDAVVSANPNIALIDLNGILQEASSTGLRFDQYTMTTDFASGGLISLDGVHLTSRGYALMANKMLEAIDNEWGSNFTQVTNGLAKADNYPTHYSPALR